MASPDQPQSLKATFQSAEEKRHRLDSTYEATSPTYRTILDDALALYESARQQISIVGLFSPNEGAEDISTSDLPYLLVDFYTAELVQKTPNLSPAQRLDVLSRARSAYERFLSLADHYALLGGAYGKLLERYRDDPDAFAVVASSDAAARREGKIANFKAEKALRDRLQTLRGNPRYLEHGDEELVRELYLTSVTFAAHSTFQALESLNREIPLLRHAPLPLSPQVTADPKPDASARLDQPLRRLQSLVNGPILSAEGKPLQPFTLVGSRSELAKGVFRPGHNLPTMTIDDYLEEEKRRGNILKGGVEEKKVVDEDDMAQVDRETYKAREWDDFKDDNRKGAGNTLNRG